ncbi:toll/interleukin-1 receptor domain-containing protein [Flavilitoribacter nigricans]|uniref:TIR domain-containing protein n=1 Tax=Flavilitoribacter nigricans (strain ATCC 23147 / DSM 23189 / NBRC 102662 / NCIMB 1420 / SS-2) TaxID=1122177 RepID=A0A2D0MWQ7_FLAN2|nr:toll/interleukin-1 receptor domain-containing protein [Flavilitoribacter nigricans]PHN00711.1 hypothetical protein CRP01_40880 [Flavilitoribacter nigricans DSM 23189 = NBRC 102662]
MVFISYKSEDVDLARKIAEAMMSVGMRVWFAEYKILDSEWDVMNSSWDDFTKVIQKGIERSSSGICLTSEAYGESKYCLFEMSMLLEKLGPDKLIEVKTPGDLKLYEKFPALKNVPSIFHRTLEATFNELLSMGTIGLLPKVYITNTRPSTGVKHLNYEDWGIQFDTSEWNLLSKGENRKVYYRQLEDVKLYLHISRHLLVGDDNKVELFESKGIDDRVIYEYNLRNTYRYINQSLRRFLNKINLIGIHLFFFKGYNHFGFTYQISGPFSTLFTKKLIRQYTITLPYPDVNNRSPNCQKAEIIIKASTLRLGKSTRLKDFLKYIPFFDAFVRSGT